MSLGIVDTKTGETILLTRVQLTPEILKKVLSGVGKHHELDVYPAETWGRNVILLVPKQKPKEIADIIYEQLLELGDKLRDPVRNRAELRFRLNVAFAG